MFSGLHIEIALWNMVGDYLTGSGWAAVLIEAGVATSGIAESFLTASHHLRTHHVHQVTIAVLTVLQNQAFIAAGDGKSFNDWKVSMAAQSPTFKFWDTVVNLEKIILIFIRAHLEANFDLCIETLEYLVGFFFAFDHYNYARWLPIHIRDMKSLPVCQEEFKSNWVASSKIQGLCISTIVFNATIYHMCHRFSYIPLDKVHEQENAKVKGKGGAIGLMENQVALQ